MKEFSWFPALLFLSILFISVQTGLLANEEWYAKEREKMVTRQIQARGINDPRILDTLRKVPRHLFIPLANRDFAYEDSPLPIGEGQTISQPYIVGYMTEILQPQETDIVLEIGTGSGYQAAVLAELVKEVYTIEIVESLGKKAKQLFEELGYKNIESRIGDGYRGWPEKGPFDKIIITAAPPDVPKPLLDQLKPGGRMIVPVGRHEQYLELITKTEEGIKQSRMLPVRFVPMTGEALK